MERLKLVSDAPLYVERKSTSSEFALTARSGEKLTSDMRRWSFPSSVDSIICKYGERWRPTSPNAQEFRLQTVYFQLLEHHGRDEEPKEIVAFHWHAVDGGGGYAGLPHLHVEAADNPLPRAHFGVTLTVEAQQNTVEYLDRLLDEAIAMVEAEVLQRIQRSPLQ